MSRARAGSQEEGPLGRSRAQRLDSAWEIHTSTCKVFLDFKLNLGGFSVFPLSTNIRLHRRDSTVATLWTELVSQTVVLMGNNGSSAVFTFEGTVEARVKWQSSGRTAGECRLFFTI